ncbi:MAG: ribonuclease Z [Bacteroidaceae bacterium]|nr:ribonuclease Z [Bacteroidaceae bacterium]
MQPFNIHVLGCGSALPTRRHLPSCQVVDLRGKLLMLDCGEGAQLSWRRTGLNWQNLQHILITHTHGDHVFGLPGLISTMGLLGRKAPLFVYAPEALHPFLECILRDFCRDLDYEVHFKAVDTQAHFLLFEDRSMEVWTLPLSHRVPCCGYLIKEKAGLPHIRREMIDFYNIPLWAINKIKAGADWELDDGTIVPHEHLTSPADRIRSYAYCSDTMPTSMLAEWLAGVDLLYHEATYADTESMLAEKYGHSTARQAALTAQRAGVKKLLLGHFSSRYDDESVLLREACEVFPDTVVAYEGMRISP